MQIYSDKLFKNPIKIIEVFQPKDIKVGLSEIEKLKNSGLYLLGYIRYDLSKSANGFPLLYFEAFEHFEKFTSKVPDYPIGTILQSLISKKTIYKTN